FQITFRLAIVLLGRVPELEVPILIWNETVLIVPLNILVVGYGRKIRRSNLIRHHLRTITGISLVVVNSRGLRYIFLNVVTINVAIDGWTISVRMITTASNTTLLDFFHGSKRLIFFQDVMLLPYLSIQQHQSLIPLELEEREPVVGAGAWFFLSRSNALTISFSSATSDEIVGVEELVLTLATTALLRD
nr:hypothetical protein [Tanacetum cinerariifolium]